MVEPRFIVDVADAYGAAHGLPSKTVSARVFRDSKKLDAMRDGADITITRFNSALSWFSENWPEDACWPSHVSRPNPQGEAGNG